MGESTMDGLTRDAVDVDAIRALPRYGFSVHFDMAEGTPTYDFAVRINPSGDWVKWSDVERLLPPTPREGT